MKKSSIDSEVKKFSQLSSEWWKKNGAMKTLHSFNQARTNYIHDILLNNNIFNGEILDVGCGGGILSEKFARLGYDVTGIDASDEAINIADEHAKNNNLNIKYENILPENYLQKNPDKKFNIIFAMEIIEHVRDPEQFIFILSQLLKKEGFLFMSTINRNLKSLALAKYTAEYILKWLPKNTHDYSKFIKPNELNTMFKANNLQLTDIKGISFIPFIMNWKIVQKPSINYICCAKSNNIKH